MTETLPMHHKPGEVADLSDFGFEGKAVCLRADHEGAEFITAYGKNVLWDYANNNIEEKEQTMSKPITLPELEDYQNNQVIDEVEGKLVQIYDPVDPSKWGGKFDPPQNGILKDDDGNEHRIVFAAKKVYQDPATMKNKVLNIKARTTKNGLTGLKMEDREGKDGKNYRSIRVTATAIIEQVGGRAATVPTASNGGTAEPAPAPAPAASGDSDTAEGRIILYKRLFEQVCVAFGHDPVATFQQLSPSDLKEITTGQAMSWKGQYGVYAPPVFGGALQPQSTEQPQKEQAPAGPVDTKTGLTAAQLIEENPERFAVLIEWAINKPSNKHQALQESLQDAANADHLRAVVENKLIDDVDDPDQGAVDSWCEEEFGTRFKSLDKDQMVDLIVQYDDLREHVVSSSGDELPV